MAGADRIREITVNDSASEASSNLTPRRTAALGWGALAIAAAVALAVLAQGITAPFVKDAEPQSAEWIASVARDGHWLIPIDDYGAVDRKPPLFYWMSAIVARASGGAVDEVRARVVSLAAGAALAVAILAWTAAEIGVAEGWLAFLFILGIYGYSSRATVALTDMLLTFLVFATLAILYPQLERGGSLRRAAAAGLVLGLAVLTKGPVAVVLVALSLAIYLLLQRRNPLGVLAMRWPWVTAAAAAALAAVWYVPWIVAGGHRVIAVFIDENFGHFMPAAMGGTGEASRPVWYLVPRLAGGAMPLILLIPAAVTAMAGGAIAPAKRAPLLYQASLAIAVILFFSAASAKRDDYILPALPAIAILGASVFALETAAIGPAHRWAVWLRNFAAAVIAGAMLAGVIGAIAIASAKVALPIRLRSSDALFLARFLDGVAKLRAPYLMMGIVVVLGALAAFFALARRRALWAGAAVGVLSLAGSLFFNASLRPELARMRTVKEFARAIHERAGASAVYAVSDLSYELSFYYGARVPPLTGPRASPPPAAQPIFVVAYPREAASIPAEYRGRMRLIMRSDLIGGEGPPALYEIAPAGGDGGLNPPGGSAR